jgi:hypothetical protein
MESGCRVILPFKPTLGGVEVLQRHPGSVNTENVRIVYWL